MKQFPNKTFFDSGGRSKVRDTEIIPPTSASAVPELKAWEDRLGIFDKIRLNKMTRREISNYLGEVFINRMKAAKEVQLARDAHWVEEQKEVEYLASQQRMSAVEREMTISATEFVDALVDACYEYNVRFWEKKVERASALKAKLGRGTIFQADYDTGLALIDEFADAQCLDVQNRVDAVLSRLKERFDRALTLFEGHPAR